MTDRRTATAFTALEPAPFWRHFAALTTIARPSYEEEAAARTSPPGRRSAGSPRARRGRQPVVRVPATPGREGAPTVILQGHLDMVCERDPASPTTREPGASHVVRDGDWLHADGTTLGADNGVALAAMLAAAEAGETPHGPLELLLHRRRGGRPRRRLRRSTPS